MRTRRIFALCALVAAFAASCGNCRSCDGAAAPDAAPATPASAPSSSIPSPSALGSANDDDVKPVYEDGPIDPLAKRFCEIVQDVGQRRRAECCGGKPMLAVGEQCARNLSAALRAKAVTVVEGDLDKCRAAVDAAYAGCDWPGPAPVPLPAACEGVIQGKLAEGAKCRSSLECTGEMHCAGSGPTQTGRCAKRGKEGDACGLATDALAAFTRQDAYLDRAHAECAGYCGRRTCTPYAKAGAACGPDKRCEKGIVCKSGTCGGGGPSKEGAACSGLLCGEDGLVCIFGRCLRAGAKKTGEPCTHTVECAVGGCAASDAGEPRCGGVCGVPTSVRPPPLPSAQKDAAPGK